MPYLFSECLPPGKFISGMKVYWTKISREKGKKKQKSGDTCERNVVKYEKLKYSRNVRKYHTRYSFDAAVSADKTVERS
jgi:hypothetical protein